MNLRQVSALTTLNDKLDWRSKKCRFSVTNAFAPVHSTYAAIRASAGFKPNVSYLAPNSKGISVSSSMLVVVLTKIINSLNSSWVRFFLTSSTIIRGMRIKNEGRFLRIVSKNSSQDGFLKSPKAIIYSLLSRTTTSGKFFIPEFFSRFSYSFYCLFFAHTRENRFSFRYELTQFSQMHLGFMYIWFCHFDHLIGKISYLKEGVKINIERG